MKAALILPWYGKLPWYWPLFEKSAQRMCFDVIVVAEHGFSVHGRNFRVAEMSLDELRARAESALGCKVRLDSGYKVCDLRPMFGIVFADLLSDYDYWAYGDCDVIYGMGMTDFVRKAMIGGWDVATAWRFCRRLWHRIWGWSAYLWRVATLDAVEMKRLRRFVRRKAGVKEWWL